VELAGTHQFTVGGRADRVLYHAQINRGTVDFVDGNGAVTRQITFANTPGFSLSTVESSAYIQDRWTPMHRVIIEPGGRWIAIIPGRANLFPLRTVLISTVGSRKEVQRPWQYYDPSVLRFDDHAVHRRPAVLDVRARLHCAQAEARCVGEGDLPRYGAIAVNKIHRPRLICA